MSKDLRNCLRWGGKEIGNDIEDEPDLNTKMPIVQ